MRAEIERVIRLQEQIGLDVLVHGEPERNDMVQYFAEHLDGFATTEFGWVQSYGTRCVRPPVLYADVSRPAPITVGWSTYAQSLTDRPVKAMLTGPVTILAWSFVRDDRSLGALDADVTTVEAARSTMEVLEQLGTGVLRGVGPGVYDVHSPRVPTVSEIEQLLLTAQRWVSPDRLWANPDCGLKTRGEPEVIEALRNLVHAAHRVRSGTPALA